MVSQITEDTTNISNNENNTKGEIVLEEPILTENPNRFVFFPIEYPRLYKMYKDHMAVFWTVEEIDLARDIGDWGKKLNKDEQHFIKHILAFFAASDGIVIENLGGRFIDEVQVTEAKAFYSFQMAIENIHSEMYSLLIDTFIKDNKEKDYLFNALDNIPSIKKKGDWSLRWIEDKSSNFATRLIAFACVEGIFFSGAFCSIYWLREKGIMPGLCLSNEFISRDESLHTEFAILLYDHLLNKLDDDIIYKIITEAVEIEKEFIIESIPCRLIGMNSDLMSEYIEFVADRLIVQLGLKKIYNTENPFDFMDRISIEGKSNFFEKRESNYSLAGVGGSNEGNVNLDFTNDDDDDF